MDIRKCCRGGEGNAIVISGVYGRDRVRESFSCGANSWEGLEIIARVIECRLNAIYRSFVHWLTKVPFMVPSTDPDERYQENKHQGARDELIQSLGIRPKVCKV